MGTSEGAGARPRARGPLLPAERRQIRSDTSRSQQRRRDEAGMAEDTATGVAYGGRRGRRTGSQGHKRRRAATTAQGGGQGPPTAGTWAARRPTCPPPSYPTQLSEGCTPHASSVTPACLGGTCSPLKEHQRAALGVRSAALALTPSPSWKAASGLSARFLHFKPDFPDGWRATRRSSDEPQGHMGPVEEQD